MIQSRSTPSESIAPSESTAFLDSERALRSSRTLIALALGVVMMPAGVALDAMLYPEHLLPLLAIRLVVTAVLAVGWVVAMRLGVRRPIEPLSVALIMVPSIAIAWMMYLTDAAASEYYFGLILLMIIVHLLGFRWSEAALYCSVTLVAYVLAVVAHHEFDPSSPTALSQGVFFLLTSGLVCVVICYLNRRNRLTAFLLQKQLKDQSQARLDFFANVSHELRTPLSLIVAPLDEILSTRGQLSEPVGQRLSIVRRNVDRLRLLVDDLLDVVRQRSETFRLNLTEVDAREFIEQILHLAGDTAAASGMQLQFHGDTQPMPLLIDVPRLERVVLNLLSNALKFSPSGGVIEIALRCSGDRVTIEVSDQGPGIPEALLQKVFDRMFQVDNAQPNASSQGLGLGLAISQEIVQWHHGTITATNRPAGGTTFQVSLPIAASSWEANSPRFAPKSSAAVWTAFDLPNPSSGSAGIEVAPMREPASTIGSPMPATHGHETRASSDIAASTSAATGEPRATVLIIDDEPDLRGYLTSRLAHRYRVQQASHAEEGLKLAESDPPDCILLDLMLPDSHRLSTLSAIRATPSLEDTKVLMMTANVDEQIKIDAIRRGADDFLSKPFGIAELEARVAGLVRSAQLQRTLRRRQQQLEESMRQLTQAEQQLIQSEKMRAVAGLAAGLLHEINNPASYSLMAIRVMRKKGNLDAAASETLEDIEEGVTRISRIISDLQAFAHPQQQQVREAFDLREALETAARFTRHELLGISFHIDAEAGSAALVFGSQSQLVQVLVNLLVNAAKAVRARHQEGTGEIRLRASTSADRAMIEVADNGIGITSEQLDRIREPFFTSGEGQGLGLGLSICESIIAAHGGQLEIESEPGAGTRVRFDIPLFQAAKEYEHVR